MRSSSLVTRYRDLPRMAASRISLSSGSRQTWRLPEIWTILARAAMSRTKVSASRRGYVNLRVNRGRPRTSAISAICESDVTVLKSPRRQLATTCPGGPVGFRKAEIQTLVSSRATSGTAFCLDLGPRARHLCFDDLLRDRLGASPHSAKQAFEVLLPLRLGIHGDKHAGLLFQSDWPQWPQHPVLEHRAKRFPHWNGPLAKLVPEYCSGASILWSSNIGYRR